MDVRDSAGKSSDNLDVAAELQQAYNDAALDNVLQNLKPQTHPDFNGVDCLDCDDPLTENRLADKRMRCVFCQDLFEKRAKHHGH